jgi:hypothetical protein
MNSANNGACSNAQCRFGSKAGIGTAQGHVCFEPEGDIAAGAVIARLATALAAATS